jgi:steroid 5-alpha reductase family enzyme
MTTIALMLLIGGTCASGLMLVLWLIQRRTHNAGIVDAGWAAGLVFLALLYGANSAAPRARVFLVASMAAVWGVRLAAHLLARIAGATEDGRYVEMRREGGPRAQKRVFIFFEVQALVCLVLSVPFLVPALNNAPRLHPAEYAGFALWLIGMLGEATADRQLRRFKSDASNSGKVCNVGLWRCSRHPNYFFEWVIWIGFAVFALGSPYGFLALTAPALMLYFLLCVTGIPPTEAQALRSKGAAYRRYQQTTSAFVPWYPRGEHVR